MLSPGESLGSEAHTGPHSRLRVLKARVGSKDEVTGVVFQLSAIKTSHTMRACSPSQRIDHHEDQAIKRRWGCRAVFHYRVILRESGEEGLIWEKAGREHKDGDGDQDIGSDK